MRPTKVTISYGETRSENYQSVNAHLTLEYEVESDEEAKAAYIHGKKRTMALVQGILGRRMDELRES